MEKYAKLLDIRSIPTSAFNFREIVNNVVKYASLLQFFEQMIFLKYFVSYS